MMNKEEYKKEIVRMWDSVRATYVGDKKCMGVICEECALYGIDCGNSTNAFEMIEIVEKWSKEHRPKKFKVSRLEYDILKHLSDNTALMYITRNVYGNVYLFNEEPRKSSGNWYGNGARSMSVLDELFQFVKSEDEEPTSIKDVLENCEIVEDNKEEK